MTQKKEKKSEEKKPLDMTTDEAIEFLFGQEGAQELKHAVRGMNPPPTGDDNGLKGKSKSTRKHSNS